MTESQLRYQTLMENQRHNYELERLGAGELVAKQTQAAASAKQAEASAEQARAATANAESRAKEVKDKGSQIWSDIGFTIAGFLIPDANTVVKAVASIFG